MCLKNFQNCLRTTRSNADWARKEMLEVQSWGLIIAAEPLFVYASPNKVWAVVINLCRMRPRAFVRVRGCNDCLAACSVSRGAETRPKQITLATYHVSLSGYESFCASVSLHRCGRLTVGSPTLGAAECLKRVYIQTW